MDKILERLGELFSPQRMAAAIAEKLPNVVMAIVVLLIFYVGHRLIQRALNVALKRTQLDETARVFIKTIVQYVVMTLGVVMSLSQVGIDVTSLLASLGVAGLTLGFAARDVLSNIISGVFIFWDRPFVVDDLVEISGQYGRVEKITMRSTRVVTVDGRMLAIPNSQVVNNVVTSYTNFPNLRLDIDVTVSVEEDLERIRELVKKLVVDDARFMPKPAPQMVVTALNDYNVAMQFRAWLVDERDHIGARFELREKLFETLRVAEVDMPYETLQILTNDT